MQFEKGGRFCDNSLEKRSISKRISQKIEFPINKKWLQGQIAPLIILLNVRWNLLHR